MSSLGERIGQRWNVITARVREDDWPRWLVVTLTIVAALLMLFLSWVLRESAAWWSGVTANLGATVLLLGPGAYIAHRLTGQIRDAQFTAAAANVTAKQARRRSQNPEPVEPSDEERLGALEIERELFDYQRSPLEAEIQAYADWAAYLDRESLIEAMRAGQKSGLISKRGLRTPVWETSVHVHFQSADETQVLVTLETDGGNVISRHPWQAGVDALTFYKQLNDAMVESGHHLGPQLFSPRQFIVDAAEALEYAAHMRSQKLMRGATVFNDVIECFEEWFITERGVTSKEHIYEIPWSRIDEDWEDHLIRTRNWFSVVEPIRVARALYENDPTISSHR